MAHAYQNAPRLGAGASAIASFRRVLSPKCIYIYIYTHIYIYIYVCVYETIPPYIHVHIYALHYNIAGCIYVPSCSYTEYT